MEVQHGYRSEIALKVNSRYMLMSFFNLSNRFIILIEADTD